MRHKAIIIGAGRIGAGYNWDQDLGYTHAGAYKALSDRVELLGFVEPDEERGKQAYEKWGVPNLWTGDPIDSVSCAIGEWKPDIVSVCTNPDQNRGEIMYLLEENKHIVKGVWCEKWWIPPKPRFPTMPKLEMTIPVQVNYQRRGDFNHRNLAGCFREEDTLIVYGKDNETTRCHFRDLSKFWNIKLEYRVHDGPCAYLVLTPNDPEQQTIWFDGGNGGVDSAKAFKAMLGNLLDHIDGGAPLWSPPYND